MGPIANTDKNYFKGKIEFWNDAFAHPNYDEFWQSRNLRPHLKNVHAAVMTVGGWFDAEDLFGTLSIYKETERLNPGIVNILVMGLGPTAAGRGPTATVWATCRSTPRLRSIIARTSNCRF